MKNIVCALICMLLSACAATGDTYRAALIQKTPGNQAQLVIYYPGSITGGGGPNLFINGAKKCSLAMNTFAAIAAPVGKVSVMADATMAAPATINIQTRAGHRYYIRIVDNKAKQQAGAAFGLVGLFAYNTASHGTKTDADWFFDVMDGGSTPRDLSETKQSIDCK